MTYHMLALASGFILDFIFGDPRWMYHPVCLIGTLIAKLEKKIRAIFPKTKTGELAGGTVEVLLVCVFCGGVPLGILYALYSVFPWLGFALEAFWCYQLFATKCLKQESMKVFQALETGDIQQARKAVSMIVGRDTEGLDQKGVTKAAVETVAENSSDGVIAPMLYMAIGGAPLMFLYKGINTMDSMLGYKNDKYLYFGRVPAKLDDVFNYIPSRITAVFMIAASYVCGLDGKNAWRIYRRDRRKHASPNAAQTEAVCAGALRVQLAGDAVYFGKVYKKEFIGDALRPVEPEDIRRTGRLMYVTAFLMLIVFGAAKYALGILI